MAFRFALLGNPNSGKTTLFNELTGSTAHVGNWPGVTIDRKEGRVRRFAEEAVVVDLPGVYSLSPYTPEEVVSRDYLMEERPDALINIVDATNLARNLYLTTQLMELDLPVVVALNMSDELRHRGDTIDEGALSALLGMPVVSISALRGEGMGKLMDAAISAARAGRQGSSLLAGSKLGPALSSMQGLLEGIGQPAALFYAVKLLEGDALALAGTRVQAHMKKISALQAQAQGMLPGEGLESAITALRYSWIEARMPSLVARGRPGALRTLSDRIDGWLTHQWFGIPIFFAFMFLMFHLTFGGALLGIQGVPGPGMWLQNLVVQGMEFLTDRLANVLAAANAAPWLQGLLTEGILSGVGAVLSFLPQIMLLFLFLSLLEDSGYMSRAAYLMDRPLRRFGLSGRAFLPMLMGFGCSVPAMMGTRTLETQRGRRMTRILIPYMSCGAKAPIWAIFSAAMFPRHADLVVFGIYLLGIATAVISSLVLRRTLLKEKAVPLIIELPTYRWPKLKNSLLLMWEKLKHYVGRAGTVVLASVIGIWFLSSFTWSLRMVEPGDASSILGSIGGAMVWFFRPLGFASGAEGWKPAVAILAGLLAKEAVVSSLGVLYNPSLGNALEEAGARSVLLTSIAASFTPLAALSFMAFNLLTVPCMATVAAMRAETRNAKWTAITLCIWLSTSWIASFLIFHIGRLLGLQ